MFYSKNDVVLPIEKAEYGEIFRTEKNYYFDDKRGNLIYMTERHYRYNRPIYYDEKRSIILTHTNYFENANSFIVSLITRNPKRKMSQTKHVMEFWKSWRKYTSQNNCFFM